MKRLFMLLALVASLAGVCTRASAQTNVFPAENQPAEITGAWQFDLPVALTPQNIPLPAASSYPGGIASVLNGANTGDCTIGGGTSKVLCHSDGSTWSPAAGGFTSPMTTLGDSIMGGSSGAPTRLAGPQAPNGVPQVEVSIPSGGAAAAQAWALPGITTRKVSGTTASDAITASDCAPQRVNYVGSVAVAVSLPTASTMGVPGCAIRLTNNSSATFSVTVTPVTWTINGNSTLAILQGQSCLVFVNPSGTAWDADCFDLPWVAGANVTITRGQFGPTIASTGGGGGSSCGTLGAGQVIFGTGTTTCNVNPLFAWDDSNNTFSVTNKTGQSASIVVFGNAWVGTPSAAFEFGGAGLGSLDGGPNIVRIEQNDGTPVPLLITNHASADLHGAIHLYTSTSEKGEIGSDLSTIEFDHPSTSSHPADSIRVNPAGDFNVFADFVPTVDNANNLGTLTFRWATLNNTPILTLQTRGISFTIGIPGGTALSPGSTATEYVTVPFACTITGYNLLVDAGTITVKFWKVATGTAIPTSSNSISTSGVSISTGTAIHSTTITDFTTTTVTANDILAMNVTAASTAAYVNGVLTCVE